jgi:hypothetical protein
MQIVLFIWKKNPLSLDLAVFSPRYMNPYRFAGQLAVSSALDMLDTDESWIVLQLSAPCMLLFCFSINLFVHAVSSLSNI